MVLINFIRTRIIIPGIFKNITIGCVLLINAQTIMARPIEGPISITIITPIQIQNNHAKVTLKLDGPANLTGKVLLFSSSTKGTPVTDGLVAKKIIQLSQKKQTVIRMPLKAKGDFELRAIVYPVQGSKVMGSSRSDLNYFRWDGGDEAQTYEPGDYSLMRAKERAKAKPGFGLQSQDPQSYKGIGRILNFFKKQPKTTSDGLKLNSPKYIVGEGKTDHTPAKPGATLKKTNAAAADRITILGQIKTTVNGISVPLHYTRIDVYDKDPLSPDDLLGTTRTDNQGNYNIVVKNDDGPLGGGIDVYLYIHTQKPQITLLYLVPDGEGGYTPFYYSWQSAVHDDLNDPRETINFTITSDNLASTIWAGGESGVWLTKSTTNRDLSHVEVRYPPFVSGTFYRNGIINIDPQHADSPDTIGHEYAHAVMDQAYGGFPANSGGPHALCENANTGLAWSEGFANWYGVAAWNETPNLAWHIGGDSISIEIWNCAVQDASHDEVRSAAWMWDLYDVPTDNNLGNVNIGRAGFSDANVGAEIVGTQTLLNTLWVKKQDTILEYWADLQNNLNAAEKPPSERISKFNYLISP